jgi:hypothetical protein
MLSAQLHHLQLWRLGIKDHVWGTLERHKQR